MLKPIIVHAQTPKVVATVSETPDPFLFFNNALLSALSMLIVISHREWHK